MVVIQIGCGVPGTVQEASLLMVVWILVSDSTDALWLIEASALAGSFFWDLFRAEGHANAICPGYYQGDSNVPWLDAGYQDVLDGADIGSCSESISCGAGGIKSARAVLSITTRWQSIDAQYGAFDGVSSIPVIGMVDVAFRGRLVKDHSKPDWSSHEIRVVGITSMSNPSSDISHRKCQGWILTGSKSSSWPTWISRWLVERLTWERWEMERSIAQIRR